jgi:hypothetical protein
MNSGIFNLDYVKQRAQMAGKLTRVDIYSGFVNPANKAQAVVKVQEIRPVNDRDFGNVFDFFEKTTFGDFTAVFFPSREIIYFTNKGTEVMNGTQTPNFQGIPTEEQVQAQVQKILENERLKQRLADLEAEQEETSEWGKRMGIALEMLVGNFLGLPKNNPAPEVALNGTETEYDTSNMTDTEKALLILVQNFGEDWIKKFATKIQNEPNIVPQIKNFFS